MSTGALTSRVPAAWPPSPALCPDWFAIYTRPSHEKRVVEHFELRGVEFYLPSYHVSRRWKNRCNVELELPLFPCYVFARFSRAQRVSVLEVPGVLSIVGNGRQPMPLEHSEICALRTGLPLHRAVPHPYLNVGERARIVRGPLSGLEGIVTRKSDRLRVILSVQQIMKSIAVEVEECDLEPQHSGLVC